MVRAAASSRRALRRRRRLSASPITRSSRSTVASCARSDSMVRSIVDPLAHGWSALAWVAAISRRMASGSTRRRASTRSWPRRAIRHTSSTPVSTRPSISRSRSRIGPASRGLDGLVEALARLERVGDEPSPRLGERERIDPGRGRRAGIAAATRPAHARTPSTAAPTIPAPLMIPTLAPAPRARIPSGDVVARATGGVKNRSRSESPRAMSGERYGAADDGGVRRGRGGRGSPEPPQGEGWLRHPRATSGSATAEGRTAQLRGGRRRRPTRT